MIFPFLGNFLFDRGPKIDPSDLISSLQGLLNVDQKITPALLGNKMRRGNFALPAGSVAPERPKQGTC